MESATSSQPLWGGGINLVFDNSHFSRGRNLARTTIQGDTLNQDTDIHGNVTTENGSTTSIGMGTFLSQFYSPKNEETSQPARKTPYALRSPVEKFIGREQQLQEIAEKLQEGAILIISGENRVGKSELAIKYAYDKFDSYQRILCLDATTPEIVERSIRGLYNHVKTEQRDLQDTTPGSLMSEICMFLASEKVLFIIDNAEDFESIEMLLPYPKMSSEKHHFMVTSRNIEWNSRRHRQVHNMVLSEFNREETKLYMESLGISGEVFENMIDYQRGLVKTFVQSINSINENNGNSKIVSKTDEDEHFDGCGKCCNTCTIL